MEETKIYKNPMADIVVIRLMGEHENEIDKEISIIEEELEKYSAKAGRCKDKDWCLMTIPVKNWSYDMTPWETSEATDGGGAKKKLDDILNKVIPEYEAEHRNEGRRYILAGYSLAGLFSLWASYQTDKFDAIVAGSPSVWYPGWVEYAEENICKAQNVYLSIGSKEHKTRNVLMSKVSENLKKQYEILSNRGVDTVLEINPGNHFKDVSLRMAKGIVNSIARMQTVEKCM